ncbi:MAG TPA: hypothetical protein VLA34_06575, partial [Candidatus Krumholzibacterium sp.]|nr:hypothetical protein [Candidatus Krumholzibacterium sp.]
ACLSAPVKVEIKHEPANEKGPGGNYVPAFNDDGSPKMRDVINAFFPADEDFVARVEKEAAGLDDDLPF